MTRLLFIHAFQLASARHYALRPQSPSPSKTDQMMNFPEYGDLLAGIEWDVDPGPMATHGDWPVTTQQEFMSVGVHRLPIVEKACQSGRYDGIVMLGGGDPGFLEALELAQAHRIPVVACAHAQMQVARLLGRRFSVIDVSQAHMARMRRLIREYGFDANCASLRSVDFPLPVPPRFEQRPIHLERDAVAQGRPSEMLEAAVRHAVDAVDHDGADVLIFGCSAAYWLRAPLEKRLRELGLDVPVLEGYRCAIAVMKMLLAMGRSCSLGYEARSAAARPARDVHRYQAGAS